MLKIAEEAGHRLAVITGLGEGCDRDIESIEFEERRFDPFSMGATDIGSCEDPLIELLQPRLGPSEPIDQRPGVCPNACILVDESNGPESLRGIGHLVHLCQCRVVRIFLGVRLRMGYSIQTRNDAA